MIFAFLFGLSMDLEVFMLSRMREASDPPFVPAAREGSQPVASRTDS